MLERLGLAWLATGCILLGLFPVAVIQALDPVTHALVGRGLVRAGEIGDWMLLAPISAARASYSPVVVLGTSLAIVLVTFVVVRRAFHGKLRRAPPWDCGFPMQTARMQDTAEGFGQPIRQIFEPFFRMRRHLPGPFDATPRYEVRIEDPIWHHAYLRIAAATDRVSRWVGVLQRGRISIYLLYSFLTLVALLFLAQA